MDKKLSLDIDTLQGALHAGIYLMTSDEMVADQAKFSDGYDDEDEDDEDPSKHTDFTAHPYWIHADGGYHSPEGFDSLEEIVQEMHEYIDVEMLTEDEDEAEWKGKDGYSIIVSNGRGAAKCVFRPTIEECEDWMGDKWDDYEYLYAEICDAKTDQVVYIKPSGSFVFKKPE